MFVLVLVLAVPFRAFSADKNGVSPNTISLPKGPGSIEGLGESFQPNLNTGTAKYAIGLKVPPGTAGHAPAVGLSYEGGGGNGPVGYGWNLPMACIQRRTDHGIPTYGQDVGFARQDTFINEMKEELVPQTNGYFFCQNEGAFIRYQPVGDHWEGTLPNGTRLEFGQTENSRIQNGTNNSVFSWLLERETDTHGNVIEYNYASFPDGTNQNQKYLSLIRYGPGAPPWSSYHFVSFEYEDRPDWFEDCRAGFIVRTGKRLKTIRVGTQHGELPGHLQGDFDNDSHPDYLDRAYQLSYLNYAGSNSHWSVLAKVTPVGADGGSLLPSSTFGYTVGEPPDLASAAGYIIGGSNEPAAVMDNELVELVDLNGDGLPDILKTDLGGGAHQGFLNRGEAQTDAGRVIKWDSGIDVDPGSGTAWNYNLSASDTHLADMDGDGLADLVHKSVFGDVIYFSNLGRVAWGEQQMMSAQDSAPPSPFGENDVRTADLDFDKRIDIVQSVASGTGFAYRIWFNLGQQTYSPSLTVEQDTGFDFTDPSVQIADLNGDRVPDIAQVVPIGVMVTAGLGYGHFAALRTMLLPDYTLDDTQIPRAKLTDLNGDGLADLVVERAAPGECWYWLNLGNYSFSTRKVITDLPTTLGVNAVVRWADINGNGTTDLIYADQTSVPKIQSVDLGEVLGIGATPNTLIAISNGIGRVTLVSYEPSTYFALADAAAGQPWTNLMPLSVSVVAGVTNLDSLGHAYATQFRYHDGYYDPVEKQFRGFGRVEQVEIGDSTAPTLVNRSYFDTGKEYEAMKGKLLRSTTEQEDGKVFSDSVTTWTVPPVVLMLGTNGTNVSYAHPIDTLTQIEELGQGTSRTLEQEFAYDNYGNQTRLVDYGIVENGDRTAFGDERITTTEYAINSQSWLLRHPARVELADGKGVVLSRVENYYDDETFAGDNLGVVTIGNLTLTRAWFNAADPSAYIKSSRTKFDIYGNAISLLDPLAVAPGGALDLSQGHARQIVYDADLHAYPVTETVHVGNGSADLVYQALYDPGFGVITSSTDFNANTTSYGYDVFARLINIVKPYDTTNYPTVEYDYALALPYGTNGLVNYVETRQLDKPTGTAGSNKRDLYLISRQFTDGLGRMLMTKQEAEPVPNDIAPRVVVNGAVVFNARQKPGRTLNPYFTLKTGATLDELLAYERIEDPGWQGAFHDKGQLVTLDLSSAHQSSMQYDATLRPTQNTNPDGTFTRTVYEPLVTRVFDENDNDSTSPFYNTPTVQYHDGLGRVIRTDELTYLNDDGTPANDLRTWTTTYQYDVNDRLTQVKDSQGNIKTIAYDGLKRKTSMQDLDCGTVTYTYDDASNLKKSVDAKAQEIDYTYDGANRARTEDYLDDNSPEFSYHRSPDVSYFYDQPAASVDNGDGTGVIARNTKGLLAYIQDTSGEEHMSYDGRGRVEWSIKRAPDVLVQDLNSSSFQLVSYRTSFQYDSLDRVTTMIYPDNDQVSYQYNERSLMRRIVGGPAGSILSNLVYAPSAQQQQIDYGNGVRTTYAYDNRQRLASLLTFHATNTTDQLINFKYTFDGVSNIKAIQDLRDTSLLSATDKRRNSQMFAYDDLYRLTQVQYNLPNSVSDNGGQIKYRYDRISNMLAQSSDISQLDRGLPVADLGVMSYGGSLGAFNRTGRKSTDPAGPHALSQISNLQSGTTNRMYAYDANGNMLTSDGLRCTWDSKDRLVAVEDDTMRAEYRYDYTDRRIVKKVLTKQAQSSVTQEHSTIYIGKHFEIRDHDQPTKYVFNGGTRVASITGSLTHNSRIQRFRLYAGWNLVCLAVTAQDLVGQFQRNVSGLVNGIYEWVAATSDYSSVSPGATVESGAVLWIKSQTNVTVGIVGAYVDPVDELVPVGGGAYVPGSGLEVWTPVLPATVSGWFYDASANQWFEQLAGPLNLPSDASWTLAPGQAMYLKVDATTVLSVPDPNLRIRYYHQDHLGSSGVITDASGGLVEETAFYPFGHLRNAFMPRLIEDPYQYNQKERDSESGLFYFGKRFYNSMIGRWISPDPLEEQGGSLNLYAFVNENPITHYDPNGGEVKITYSQSGNRGVYKIDVKAVVVNTSSHHFSKQELQQYATRLTAQIKKSYQGTETDKFIEFGGKKGTMTWSTGKVEIEVIEDPSTLKKDDKRHVFRIVDETMEDNGRNKRHTAGTAHRGGRVMDIAVSNFTQKRPDELPGDKAYARAYESAETVGAHELGHDLGLPDIDDPSNPGNLTNLMSENRLDDSDKITYDQIHKMHLEQKAGHLNRSDEELIKAGNTGR